MSYQQTPLRHAVARPLLYKLLDSALTRPLTLVVAPAGWGKSVLISQWITTRRDLNVAWIDVVPADADAMHFARQVLNSLSAIRPSLTELLQLVRIGDGGLGAALLEALINEFETLPATVIIFDDLHLLTNKTLQTELLELVSLFPPHVHAIFSSRVELPLASPRTRLNLDIGQLGSAQLAFSRSESAQLIRSITRRDFVPAELDNLIDRTEGWVAGLQLAGLSMRLHGSETRYVEALDGKNRLIADYLTDEVLQAQEPARYIALLRLSALNQFSDDLISELTTYQNGRDLIEQLERESLFIVPIDEGREWFRFHQLFRDALRYHFHANDRAAETDVLISAARWHVDRGDVNTAADYLIRAKQWASLMDLILDRGAEVFERGEVATVIRWVEEIPASFRSTRRRNLELLRGILLTLVGKSTAAEDILRAIATDSASSVGERIVAMSFVASLVQFRSPASDSARFGLLALDLLEQYPDEPIPMILGLTSRRHLTTQCLGSVGRAYFLDGEVDLAQLWLTKTLESDGASYPVYAVHGLGALALAEAWKGNLTIAETLANRALDIANEHDLVSHPAPADAYLALARVAIDHGELGKAALWHHEGATRAASNRRTALVWVAQLIASLLNTPRDQTDTASVASAQPAIVLDELVALRARSLRLAGNTDAALQLLKSATSSSARFVTERIATALETGDLEFARVALVDHAQIGDLDPRTRAERLALAALLAHCDSRPRDAKELVHAALEASEQNVLVRPLLDIGPSFGSLVEALASRTSSFARLFLAKSKAFIEPSPGAAFPVLLTKRERELIAHLPTRMSNAGIAALYSVSVNTIKTHMAHIYQKLEVTTRDAAIARLRSFGLLE